MQDDTVQDWPGKADGVPRPPTPEEVDEVSSQQHLITDEWASEPPPSSPASTAASHQSETRPSIPHAQPPTLP